MKKKNAFSETKRSLIRINDLMLMTQCCSRFIYLRLDKQQW
ncbi:hypothetical protein P8610_16560 [Fictibacillus sp. UD]